MTNKLSLNLCRYAIIWNIERLENRIKILNEKEKQYPELKELKSYLYKLYFDYTQQLLDLQ